MLLSFIATELLLVIVNSCLERHLPHGLLFVIVNSCLERYLPHGLLFVIANSTSILHVCLNVIAMIVCSAWHKLFMYLYSLFKRTLGLTLICCLFIFIPTLNKTYLKEKTLINIQCFVPLNTATNIDKTNRKTTYRTFLLIINDSLTKWQMKNRSLSLM